MEAREQLRQPRPPGLFSIREERHHDALVATEEHRSCNGRGPEPVAHLVQGGVESRVVPTIQRQCKLDGAVVLEVGECESDKRESLPFDQLVSRAEGLTAVTTLTKRQELYDVTFDLLGSSTEDLFFPRNYIVVEGAADQVIVERALELLGTPSPTIKVLSARGIDTVRDAVESVVRALVPMVVNDSPYARRVVALIDQPRTPEPSNVTKLRSDLGDRLYILDASSMEEYFPEELYERAGRSKAADLDEIERLRQAGDSTARESLKKEISIALATVLTAKDLNSIAIVTEAARRAINESG